MENWRAFAALGAALMLPPLPAAGATQAQMVCGVRAAIVAAITGKYGEAPKAIGIAGQKNLAELFVSKSGSWTMLITQPHGPTCILATGESWEELPPTLFGDPS